MEKKEHKLVLMWKSTAAKVKALSLDTGCSMIFLIDKAIQAESDRFYSTVNKLVPGIKNPIQRMSLKETLSDKPYMQEKKKGFIPIGADSATYNPDDE